jgi:hypothetical protein
VTEFLFFSTEYIYMEIVFYFLISGCQNSQVVDPSQWTNQFTCSSNLFCCCIYYPSSLWTHNLFHVCCKTTSSTAVLTTKHLNQKNLCLSNIFISALCQYKYPSTNCWRFQMLYFICVHVPTLPPTPQQNETSIFNFQTPVAFPWPLPQGDL